MLDLLQRGTLPALAETAAARNGCSDIVGQACVTHTGAGDDRSIKQKCICSKPSTIQCCERRLMMQMLLFSYKSFP